MRRPTSGVVPGEPEPDVGPDVEPGEPLEPAGGAGGSSGAPPPGPLHVALGAVPACPAPPLTLKQAPVVEAEAQAAAPAIAEPQVGGRGDEVTRGERGTNEHGALRS